MDLVPLCRLFMRPLQFQLVAFFTTVIKGTDGPSTFPSAFGTYLSMVVRRSQPVQRRYVSDLLPSLTLTMYEGLRGFGTHVQDVSLPCVGRGANRDPH